MADKFERRLLLTSELRAKPLVDDEDDDNDEERSISGYAARYNSLSPDLGGFRERIQRGAFRDTVKRGDDVVALYNHDPNLVLGRVSNGTLKLTDDDNGLHFSCALPNTSTGRDLHESIKRGDVAGCSFSFQMSGDPNDQSWQEQDDPDARGQRFLCRTIKAFQRVIDCGPVTFPAYPSTSVATRSALHAGVIVTDVKIPVDTCDYTVRMHNERVQRRRDLLNKIMS